MTPFKICKLSWKFSNSWTIVYLTIILFALIEQIPLPKAIPTPVDSALMEREEMKQVSRSHRAVTKTSHKNFSGGKFL
ncbi:MAG: hypothetical protein H6Q76_1302 [Firmicutes bacterium]|nr:hypothetical protein [Bacillota bacterium]